MKKYLKIAMGMICIECIGNEKYEISLDLLFD